MEQTNYNKPKIAFNPDFKGYLLDVDKIIDRHNANNAHKLNVGKLDRKKLAGLLGVNKQVFVNWKAGKTPKLIYILFKLMEVGEMEFSEVITKIE